MRGRNRGMSKKESQFFFQIISEFINSLSEEQYDHLLNGNAAIEYKVKTNSINKSLKESLLNSKAIEDVESIFKGMLKKQILLFCEINGVDVRKSDTKKVLIEKIAAHFHKVNSESKSAEDNLKKVREELGRYTEVEKAREFLSNHPLLKTKKEIVHFARLLDVYVHQKQSKAIILNRIIESVVGSQVRAKLIRGTS
jgi:hypothetical protein